MGTFNHNVQRYGLSEVYSPSPSTSIQVDVVFVHGLNGDPHQTWTSKPSEVFWPADLLPQFVDEQKARVLVYGYDADVTSLASGGTTKDKIHNHAERLVADLFANRRIRKATERPIIFLAHSLGGLVVKRALIYSSDITGVKTEHLRSIFVSTYGVLFLGTPHKGSDIASWGSFLEWLCKAVPKKALDTSDQLVEALKANSETLQNIDRQFSQLLENFHLFFFHEAKPTDFKTTLRFIVEEESAAPTLPDVERAGIQADHSHMCKFENESSPGFDLVVDGIQRYAEDAPTTIAARWTSEREERMTNKIRKAKEMFSGNPDSLTIMQNPPSVHSSTPSSSIHDLRELDSDQKSDSPRPITDSHFMPTKSSEPYYVVPPGFRPNTFFVGMEKELESIEKRLFDKKRRAMGTACVLIYGQAGAGKSHLARQYVNKNRRRFSGGVFWLHAWSFEELWKDYWQIAQKVVAKDSPELRVSGIGTGREFIEVVKEWFEGRREWLIVLDCVNVDTDEDINKLQRFIPNSRDSSLIYVSRARRLETLERLLRPEAIRVGPLREDDACKLLFKSIPISSPRDVQRKSAKELVKKVGGLPLAINAISCRIAYTHEPLEKYTIRSYSEDEMIGGRYHEIMDDLRNRGHFEAFNLVNVLCFFGPHIPVEMVHLGLGAFKHEKIEVKSTESGATSDINTTFGILMRYGLIERNEPDDRYLMSSSNSSLVDQDSIDMLKMHMVVQKFCCDSLNTTNFLPIFLTYAVRLFCRSFGEADQIIKSRQEHGRVTDYREYLVHGQRLRGHTLQYENKTQLLGKVRKELDPILHLIKEEIRHREPSSSQESVQGPAEFQISVFDRTISSSSSGLSVSGIRTPDRIHLPFALIDKDEHGKPLGQPSKRSSGSMDLASPVSEPRLVHGGPNMHLATAFDGMEHERPYLLQEGLPDEALCQRTISDPRGGDPLQAAHSNGRPQRRAYTKRAFEPSPANTHLNRESVAGSVIRSQKEANGIFSGFSGAVLALAKVHHASPPPSRGSLWSTNSSSRSPAGISSRPTYTETLVGQPRMPSPLQSLTHSPTQHSGAHSGFSTTIERGRTTKDLRPELVPAASEKPFQYHQLEDEQKRVVRSFSHVFAGSNYIPVSAKLTSSFHSYNPPQNGNAHLSYTRFRGYGPGSNPLPSDHSITAMSRHPVLRTAQSQPYNFDNHGLVDSAENPDLFLSRHAILGHSSPPPATKVQMFPGYRSQPLSRDHSHQSRDSAATEPFPGHPTSISPYLNSIAMDSSSSRMRNLGASPAHQSPNLDHYQAVRPTLHHSGSPDTMVRSEPDLLSGAGGWAAPMPGEDQGRVSHFSGGRSNHSPTTALVRPTTRKRPGSRTAVEGLETVEFEREVVFRDFEPTSVAEARRRLREWEIGLKARERQLGTRVGDPSAAVARLSFGVGQEGGERSHLAGWVNTSIADLDIRDQDKTPHLELSRFPVD